MARKSIRQAGASTKAARTSEVYQLKITLNSVKPLIWRRVEAKDCTLARLHDIIQTAMGWMDGHLHVFEIEGEQFGLTEQWADDFGDDVQDSRKIKLSRLVDDGIKGFSYTYDMGDGWEHKVEIEKVVAAETGVKYPRCVAGARACPPEDCGGPGGYARFLEAIGNRRHPDHEQMTEWIGREFDPEAFSVEETNEPLR
jgi:hypothetical protein